MAEWDSLENYCGLRSTEGSNPSLPARTKCVREGAFLLPPSAPIEGTMFESLPPRQKQKIPSQFVMEFFVLFLTSPRHCEGDGFSPEAIYTIWGLLRRLRTRAASRNEENLLPTVLR